MWRISLFFPDLSSALNKPSGLFQIHSISENDLAQMVSRAEKLPFLTQMLNFHPIYPGAIRGPGVTLGKLVAIPFPLGPNYSNTPDSIPTEVWGRKLNTRMQASVVKKKTTTNQKKHPKKVVSLSFCPHVLF